MESVKDYLGRFFVGHGDEKEEENRRVVGGERVKRMWKRRF